MHGIFSDESRVLAEKKRKKEGRKLPSAHFVNGGKVSPK